MNGWKSLIAVACILAAAIAFLLMNREIQQLTAERDKYKGNTAALLSDVEIFKMRDSLNAARVESLQLTIKEFERFRASDAELIRELKARSKSRRGSQADVVQILLCEPCFSARHEPPV